MSAVVKSSLESQAVATIQKEGAVRFSIAELSGRLYFQDQDVGYAFVDRVKAACAKAGITVCRIDVHDDHAFVGGDYKKIAIKLKIDPFK